VAEEYALREVHHVPDAACSTARGRVCAFLFLGSTGFSRRTSAANGPIMGYTQWMLVQQSDLTFRFVAERRYADFYAGRGTLPQARPAEVRPSKLCFTSSNAPRER